jgi:hypothetical protein
VAVLVVCWEDTVVAAVLDDFGVGDFLAYTPFEVIADAEVLIEAVERVGHLVLTIGALQAIEEIAPVVGRNVQAERSPYSVEKDECMIHKGSFRRMDTAELGSALLKLEHKSYYYFSINNIKRQ